ncbi:MAG: hypothetical protein CMQ40_05155 [Gammaproteobacteria bacterium]|nr:hypothetical protein [Gammaproteobacteria bacterium]
MSLKIYTGLPASGKTSAIISEMDGRRAAGDTVVLVLSNEHEELTRRPNVRAGGLMGCRDKTKKFPIDYVIGTQEASEMLELAESGSLIVFDEAQYFGPQIAKSWMNASGRGVDVIVGTPSVRQLEALEGVDYQHRKMEVFCRCGKREATQVMYGKDLVYPLHLCNRCYDVQMRIEEEQLLDIVKSSEPFPGERHTYQPLYGIDMSLWKLVRNDCPARLNIILDAVSRAGFVQEKLNDAVKQPSFIDLGCCSGFFSHAMAEQGFLSAGVDVSKDFISWATQAAYLKGQAVKYESQDVLEYLQGTEKTFDVTSTFATIQWVMDQKGYNAGIECFEKIFAKTKSICVIEMGYTDEDIYKKKIQDRPVEIDKHWVLKLMKSSGNFASIEFHPAGEAGIWRDIFVGFKQEPSSPGGLNSWFKVLSLPSLQPLVLKIRKISRAIARRAGITIGADSQDLFDRIPVIGATQISAAKGYWADNWVAPSFQVALSSDRDLSRVELEGWRPEGWDQSTITLYFSGEKICSETVGSGLFSLQAEISVDGKDQLYLEISNSYGFTPEDDSRELSFVLRKLAFS